MEEKLSTKKSAGKDRTSEPMFRYGLCQPVFLFCFTRHFYPGNYIIPIPPSAPAGIAGAGSLMVETTDSVVSRVAETLVAFCSALLVTLTGSRIPAWIMSTYSSLYVSNPTPTLDSFTLLITTAPSRPAFVTMWNRGASSAFCTILAPIFSSPSRLSISSASCVVTWMYAEPPPAMIPSSTAAHVAF